MDISKVSIFIEVADQESFTLAAENLDMTRSKVSRHIKELEDSLEVQLFHRTTRNVTLTQMGQRFYDNTKHLITELNDAERKLKLNKVVPSGVLRVSFPSALGIEVLSRLTSGFLNAYPKVQMEVVLSDAPEDLISKGIDCAIRGGDLQDSSIICRYLFAFSRCLYTSASLEGLSGLKSPSDLKHFNWVAFKNWKDPNLHLISTSGDEYSVRLAKPVLNANSLLFVRNALLEGVGIGVLPEFLASEGLKEGRLIRLLPEYSLKSIEFYFVYPNTSYVSPALNVFKEYCYKNLESILTTA